MSRKKPCIGITLGDCAGIGPEIIRLALKSDRLPKSADYKIIGKYPDCSLGKPTAETSRAAAAALEEAVTVARRGELDAIVTGPVHKATDVRNRIQVPRTNGIFCRALRREKFRDVFDWRKPHRSAGHGAHSSAQSSARAEPIRDRSSRLVASGFCATPQKLDGFKRSDPETPAPRIAVAGLNPHAGESGKLGREEIEIMAPAIEELNRHSSLVARHSFSSVPFPPTLFSIAPLKANSTRCFACTTIRG